MLSRGAIQALRITTRVHSKMLLRRQGLVGARWHGTNQELDATRAYIVLAHAEIEAFCEDLVAQKAQGARAFFDARGAVRPTLRRMIAYYVGRKCRSWSEVTAPPARIVGKACDSHHEAIRTNHGLKRTNLEKMLYPIGLVEADFDPTWVAQMDSLGVARGGWAHNTIRALTKPSRPTLRTADSQPPSEGSS